LPAPLTCYNRAVAEPRKVLFVAAEMAPLVKVGGLADVGGALPRALRRAGLDVRVALPFYDTIDRASLNAERLATLGDGAALWRAETRDVPVYIIEQAGAFARGRVYGFDDDVERFLAFDDALLAAATTIDWSPDVLHLNDWHTGFIASRLAFDGAHPWRRLPRILTIHNLGFPGDFDQGFAERHGFSKQALHTPSRVDSAIAYSALAQGILHSHALTTVSPTYAREIQAPDFGGDLAPLLRQRADRLSGIINGIDDELYDPTTDSHLAATFDAGTLERRIENRRAVQRQAGLPEVDDVPLVGMVTRLFAQKGPDLAARAVDTLLAGRRFQFVVLGEGDEENEGLMSKLAARHPEPVAVCIDFDAALGQLIYGGCDIFLMPSRYEPCGLGQMMALRYGAVPVVRRTGGLADTVEDCDAALTRGTGFVFDEPSAAALAAALELGLDAFAQREAWRRLQQRCMARDFSWGASAREYAELYERSITEAKP
jgi:starch synthase